MTKKTSLKNYQPRLTFSALAWLKLQYLCHAGETEVGGFGVARGEDPLYLTDFFTVKQSCTAVTVEFDDESVANHFDARAEEGLTPSHFGRVWIHTHPYNSAQPSGTDEETFSRVFGQSDWAVMFILAKGGQTYARLRFEAGPGGQMEIPVYVDWPSWVKVAEQIDADAWAKEYSTNVVEKKWESGKHPSPFTKLGKTNDSPRIDRALQPYTDTEKDRRKLDAGAWVEETRKDLLDNEDGLESPDDDENDDIDPDYAPDNDDDPDYTDEDDDVFVEGKEAYMAAYKLYWEKYEDEFDEHGYPRYDLPYGDEVP